jgi:hypothetical protein
MTPGIRDAIASVSTDVPLDPDADEARKWILEELSDPRYESAKPTWFDQLSSAFLEWLGSLFEGSVGGPSGLLLGVLIAIIVAALVAAFLIFGRPALNRRSTVSRALFGRDDERSAEEMRRAGDAAASVGDWSLAIEECFRAIARGLAERTIVATTPGTTAHGFASRAGTAFPALAVDLETAATAFDRVRYLGEPGEEADYRAVAALEGELRSARAPLPAAAAVTG